MREIKFRGIAIDTGEFVYGYLMYSEQDDTYYIGTAELMTPVKADTVGQFTGVFDKHGVEVYEGDIVSIENGSVEIGSVEIGSVLIITVCKFELGMFTLMAKDTGNWTRQLRHEPERLTVIGNIYKNPELL